MAKTKNSDKTQDTKKALEALGRKMKKIRGKQNLTQKALSEKCGVGIPQLSKYEKGIAFPNDSNLIKIARGLGVTVSELVPEKAYLDDPRFEPYRGDKISFSVGDESKEDTEAAETNENNAPNISIYAPDDESADDEKHDVDDHVDKNPRPKHYEEIHYGFMTANLVDRIINTTNGNSNDPLFIAAERLLLEAYIGYCYISYGSMNCLMNIADLLQWSEPKAFVEDDSITEIDEMFDELRDDYDDNFANDKYEAVKSQLQAMPELMGIFLSCLNRVNKLNEFMRFYTVLLNEEDK